jgi:hypothetical protein
MAITRRIETAHVFQRIACVLPAVGDTILSCSNAVLVNRQAKEGAVSCLNLYFDMHFQNSVSFWRESSFQM